MKECRYTPPCDWLGPVKNYFLLPFLSSSTTSADIANKKVPSHTGMAGGS